MKKLLLGLLLISGLANAQYYYGGYHYSEAVIEAELIETPEAYALFHEGNKDITNGSWILYPSAAVLGWGIGTELGGSYATEYYTPPSSAPYLIGGGLGVILGYTILAKGIQKKKRAIAIHHKKKKAISFNLEPIANKRGLGLAIKLD